MCQSIKVRTVGVGVVDDKTHERATQEGTDGGASNASYSERPSKREVGDDAERCRLLRSTRGSSWNFDTTVGCLSDGVSIEHIINPCDGFRRKRHMTTHRKAVVAHQREVVAMRGREGERERGLASTRVPENAIAPVPADTHAA